MSDFLPVHDPHALPADEVLQKLGSKPDGLSTDQAEQRRAKTGFNELEETASEHWFLRLLKQFKSLMVMILVAAAIISVLTGHYIDAWVIIGVIVVNALIGFVQETRAAHAIAALRKMMVSTAKVYRDGVLVQIPSRELVPGDVIVLEEGDSIPADARLLLSKNLRVIEASLTGESVPVGKETTAVAPETVLADRKNMIWKGTFAVSGYAQAIVTGTGANTALGDIAQSLTGIEQQDSNFKQKTDTLARHMAIIAICSAATLFLVGFFFRDFDTYELLLISIAALVAAIPEGLPAVLSVVLAIGANRMASRKALVRDFTATEALGSVTTIITDKTGTLTQNSLTAKKLWVRGQPEFSISGDGLLPEGTFAQNGNVVENVLSLPAVHHLLHIAAWSNNSAIRQNPDTQTYELTGDPTEGALLVAAQKAGLSTNNNSGISRLDDLPFNSKLKMRATLVQTHEGNEIWVVGAPEKVLAASGSVLNTTGEEKLTSEARQQIEQQIENWSDFALRVLALAYRKNPSSAAITEEDVTADLVFVGIVGMIDPPRPDVRESVEKCHEAGIRVIMATGDHKNTAIAIARQTGILPETPATANFALTEAELVQLTEEEFEKAVSGVNVFARLTPRMKLRIAEKLQAQGQLIAMTGDGVNDAPALKRADVGIAMGIMGTDVARESAKMVLADDNFSTIVHAIEEGRIVFTNARQTSFFMITTNFAEIITLISVISIGLPMPLTATQILWLNLVTDGVGDLSLATEKGHGDVLRQKPVPRTEQILNKSVLPFVLINAVVMTALSLAVYFYYLPQGLHKARTGVFIIMAFTQLYNLFNMRSLIKSVFSIGMFSNKYINLGLLVSIILQIVIIEVPALANLFGFEEMSWQEFLLLAVIASAVLWVGELYKWLRRKSAKI